MLYNIIYLILCQTVLIRELFVKRRYIAVAKDIVSLAVAAGPSSHAEQWRRHGRERVDPAPR